MAERKKDPRRVTLKNVRLSYPNVWEARAFADGDGKPAFSAAFLIPKDTTLGKDTILDIEDAIEAAKEAEWDNKIPKIKRSNIAFRDGDDDQDGEIDLKPENEGMMIVPARNYKRPKVLDRDKTELVEADNVIYGGCFVDAIVTFWAQTYKNTPRINCSLEGIRFREDGEAFGAPPISGDDFDDLPDDRESRRSRSSRDDDDRPSRSRRDEADDDRPSRSRRDEPDDRRSRRDEAEAEDDARSARRREEDDGEPRRSRRDEPDDRRSRRDERDDREDRRSRRDERDDDRPSRSRRDEEADDRDRPSRNSRSRRDDDI